MVQRHGDVMEVLYYGVPTLLFIALAFMVLRPRSSRYVRPQGTEPEKIGRALIEEIIENAPPESPRPARPHARAAKRARGLVGEDDDGFAPSFIMSQATGVPVGKHPGGALLGAASHGNPGTDASDSSPAPSVSHISSHASHTSSFGDSGSSSGGDGGGGGGGD